MDRTPCFFIQFHSPLTPPPEGGDGDPPVPSSLLAEREWPGVPASGSKVYLHETQTFYTVGDIEYGVSLPGMPEGSATARIFVTA